MGTSNSLKTLPASSGRSFSVIRKIRFGETDSAGIVYYPNYFDMFNEIVEDWFEEDLGMSFWQLHQGENLGIPMAHVECDFVAPCMLGDTITLSLTATDLGRTSLKLQIIVSTDGEIRLRANLIVVFVDLLTFRPIEPPEALRALIASRVIAAPLTDEAVCRTFETSN
jgi:4-hydroxybenzoyl-CoA thioesterase